MSKVNLKSFAATTAIMGALGFTAIGVGAGLATTAPLSPSTDRTLWADDDDDDWDDRGWRRGDWDRGDWRGPVGWRGPGGCVAATDASGLVTGWFCI